MGRNPTAMRAAHYTLVSSLLLACSSAGGEGSPTVPSGLTRAEYQALRELSPAEGLPVVPRDASNRFADDPRAARFGQTLFFDPGFSGRLLDGDNDGSAA